MGPDRAGSREACSSHRLMRESRAAMIAPLILAFATTFLVSSAACSKTSSDPPSSTSSATSAQAKRYDARGVIKGFTEGRKAVNIAHEDIPNFMKAMTMPFELSTPSAAASLNEGDAVDFSFTDEGGRFLIVTIKKR